MDAPTPALPTTNGSAAESAAEEGVVSPMTNGDIAPFSKGVGNDEMHMEEPMPPAAEVSDVRMSPHPIAPVAKSDPVMLQRVEHAEDAQGDTKMEADADIIQEALLPEGTRHTDELADSRVQSEVTAAPHGAIDIQQDPSGVQDAPLDMGTVAPVSVTAPPTALPTDAPTQPASAPTTDLKRDAQDDVDAPTKRAKIEDQDRPGYAIPAPGDSMVWSSENQASPDITGMSPEKKENELKSDPNAMSESPTGFKVAQSEEQKGIPKHQAKVAGNILRNIKRTKDAFPFLKPVDIVALKIPHYPNIVTQPMDMETLEKKFTANEYTNIDQVDADFNLIISNCEKFNGPNSTFTQMARRMQASFQKQWKNIPGPDLPPPEPAKKKAKKGATSPGSTFALAPSGLPQIRRESTGGDGRPKREIHPPKNRDLPAHNPRRKKNAEEIRFCTSIVKELLKKQHEAYAFPFYQPVDPVAMNIPDYYKVVKKPMDLSTVQGKINNNQYDSSADFEYDVRLMFKNCYKFNAPGTPVHNMSKRLEAVFDQKWAEKPAPRGSQSPDSSDEDSEREDNIDMMQRQLAMLQEQIQTMSKGKKAGGSGNGVSHGRSSSFANKSSKNKRKKHSDVPLVIDYQMKQELADKVALLEGDALQTAVHIIKSGTPQLSLDEDEVELDLESMNPVVLQRLYKFVVMKNGNPNAAPSAPTSAPHSRKPSHHMTAAGTEKKKKHRPMNENEQDAAIRAAQRKLAKFKGEPVSPSESESESSSDDDDDDAEDASSSEEE